MEESFSPFLCVVVVRERGELGAALLCSLIVKQED